MSRVRGDCFGISVLAFYALFCNVSVLVLLPPYFANIADFFILTDFFLFSFNKNLRPSVRMHKFIRQGFSLFHSNWFVFGVFLKQQQTFPYFSASLSIWVSIFLDLFLRFSFSRFEIVRSTTRISSNKEQLFCMRVCVSRSQGNTVRGRETLRTVHWQRIWQLVGRADELTDWLTKYQTDKEQ